MLFAQTHAHEAGESLWTQYVELVTDPAHILLELTLIVVVDLIIGALLWPLFKKWVKRHDKEHHDHECEAP
jgi:predicted Na+-dependent transporter